MIYPSARAAIFPPRCISSNVGNQGTTKFQYYSASSSLECRKMKPSTRAYRVLSSTTLIRGTLTKYRGIKGEIRDSFYEKMVARNVSIREDREMFDGG